MGEATGKLERASLEAYGGIAIAIFLAVLPMSWWLKAIAFVVLAALATDISCRSPWTYRWSGRGKAGAAVISAAIIAAIGYGPVARQYAEDHIPTEARFKLSIDSLLMCDYLPPWPPNSVAMIVWAAVDNSGAPSVAKDWSLTIAAPGYPTETVRLLGFGRSGGNICGRSIRPDSGLDLRTENDAVRGVERGRLLFVSQGIPHTVVANPQTVLSLSALDKANHVFGISRAISEMGPRFSSPPAAPLPAPAQPNTPAKN